MQFTKNLVSEISKKQELAIKLAANSDDNSMGLTEEEAGIVCRTAVPRAIGSSFQFVSDSHSELWQELFELPLEKVVEIYLRQINNRRIVQEVLGDD